MSDRKLFFYLGRTQYNFELQLDSLNKQITMMKFRRNMSWIGKTFGDFGDFDVCHNEHNSIGNPTLFPVCLFRKSEIKASKIMDFILRLISYYSNSKMIDAPSD